MGFTSFPHDRYLDKFTVLTNRLSTTIYYTEITKKTRWCRQTPNMKKKTITHGHCFSDKKRRQARRSLPYVLFWVVGTNSLNHPLVLHLLPLGRRSRMQCSYITAVFACTQKRMFPFILLSMNVSEILHQRWGISRLPLCQYSLE